jgi:hypothetical protein
MMQRASIQSYFSPSARVTMTASCSVLRRLLKTIPPIRETRVADVVVYIDSHGLDGERPQQ